MAHAKSLIIHPYNPVQGGQLYFDEARINTTRNIRLVESIIRATGGDYRTVMTTESRTEWARTGQQVWNPGKPGAYVEPFDAVILLGSTIISVSAGQVRGDSLTRMTLQGDATRTTAAVPSMMIRDNACVLANQEAVEGWSSNADSSGVNGTDIGPGKSAYMNGETNAFLTHAYTVGGTGAYDTGDMRKILFGRFSNHDIRGSADDDGGISACTWCDSLASYAETDTLLLWDRQYGTRLGQASTMSFLSAYGAGSAADSMANADALYPRPATEGDFALLLAGLAHLDSLSGGGVLGSKVIRIAPVVYGGLARGERHAWKSPGSAQGIFNPDTASFYAILDSLDALGIPVTFAVNVDSAASYERDIIKLKSVRMARFTPQIWNGVSDSSKAGGQNALYRPVDVFGRYRKRAAVGDSVMHTVPTSDSSIATLARSARRMCDSLFAGRTSTVLAAPDDDWSPKQITGTDRGGTGIDSVLYALQLAGFSGIIVDAQDPNASALKRHGPSSTNPRGYYNVQQRYRKRLDGAASGSPSTYAGGGKIDFKLLAHTGYNIMGGRAQSITYDDSTATGSGPGIIYKELSRVWSGALLEYDDSYDTWPDDLVAPPPPDKWGWADRAERKVDLTEGQSGKQKPVKRGNIYRLSCSELSGKPGGPPAATGYHVLKALRNAMITINKLAGRTVVTFSYPEDIEP